MTKLETGWQLGMMPDFDTLEMKAKIQAEILRETEGMTGEEYIAYLKKSREEMRRERKQNQAEMKRRRLELAAENRE
jgi:hypothetical protein